MKEIFARPKAPSCEEAVGGIIRNVQEKGDTALVEYARKFDRQGDDYRLKVPQGEIAKAAKSVSPAVLEALKFAAKNIAEVSEKTKPQDKLVKAKFADITQKFVALESVGIYAPGGRAAYPSTVLMCAIPAKVAGVKRIVLCSPPPVSDAVLAAAFVVGIEEVYAVGGAQAVAAMAYGTTTVPKVDKIVGPGNQYVTEAKRQVRGFAVDIDMLAGPTEVFIVADGSADASFVAADMIAQLEHGNDSAAIAITTAALAAGIEAELGKQLSDLPRKVIVLQSLKNSAILTTDFSDLQMVADAINLYAPEHLELQTSFNAKLLALVRNAGAVFLGAQSCEAFGDYCAGSNHVLPTGGSARFSSGLSVASFMKCIEVVDVKDAQGLVKTTAALGRVEGLEGHARSAEKRGRK